MSAEARRLHPRLHDDAEEAELGAAQSRARPAHQRHRGDVLHSRRWPQPAGALGGADPRHARFDRRARAAPEPVQIRREEAEVGTESCRVKAKLKKEKDCRIPSTGTSRWRNSSIR